jgi:hypothetical protein
VIGVVDTGVQRGMGGVVGTTWGMTEVDEARDKGAAESQAIRMPASILGEV